MIKDNDLIQLVEPILQWYKESARSLPWREDVTPYRVWVSEIMLQQTRVEAVRPYFERFIANLPDIRSLAECPEDMLMKLWEGLGYYNRARNMKQAAVRMMEEYGGALPADYETLLTLKGIGHYTAGAIASIAYGIPVPAVDGNVLRVLTRVTADDTDIMKQSFRRETERILTELMRAEDKVRRDMCGGNFAGTFNQALMELGATVCLPNGTPDCAICPWRGMCRAKNENKIELFPVKKKAKLRRIEKRTVLVIRDEDRVAIRKRSGKGLLAGLYELPNVEGEISGDEALALVKEMRFEPIRIWELPAAKHIFSHVEWHMKGYAVLVAETAFSEKHIADDLIFIDAGETRERYAIPAAFAAYVRYMQSQPFDA